MTKICEEALEIEEDNLHKESEPSTSFRDISSLHNIDTHLIADQILVIMEARINSLIPENLKDISQKHTEDNEDNSAKPNEMVDSLAILNKSAR